MTRLLFLLLGLLGACTPQPPAAIRTTPEAPHRARSLPEPAAAPDEPRSAPPHTSRPPPNTSRPPPNPSRPPAPTPLQPPRLVRTELSGIPIELVAFDARSHRLAVADQPDGPGSQWPDARAAGRARHGLAAINGGFFTPEGQPLGRVIDRGKATGPQNRTSSLASGFYLERDGRPALLRRDRFQTAHYALQTGPFLIERGAVVDGLGERVSSARSFLATDGRDGWLFARCGPCSLRQLARALHRQTLADIRLQTVLNLDGGRSSELWVSAKVKGGPEFTRPLWNRPVRNFLILQPRPADPP